MQLQVLLHRPRPSILELRAPAVHIRFADLEELGEAWEDDDWDGLDDGLAWVDDEDDYRREVEIIARDPLNINCRHLFCPIEHRIRLIRIWSKHACQHSLRHCKTNNLTEVWAYLWNSWYRKDRWKLWARSAYEASIPRKRTTMIVESLWRGIKRLVLRQYNRPRIDFAQYSIVTAALTRYCLTLGEILENTRAARAASLSHTQESFKRAWERLEKAPIRGEYSTDIRQWTCDCGSQKYHTHLLCKHLVQAAGHPHADWWPTVTRYHIPPFYTVPVDGITPAAPETMCNHDWADRMRKGRSAIVARPRRIEIEECNDSDADIPEAESFRRASSLITSSPDKAPPTGRDGMLRSGSGGGAGFDLDDEEDVELDSLERCLTKGAIILREQANNLDGRFFQKAAEQVCGTIHWVCKLDNRVMPDAEEISLDNVTMFLERAGHLLQSCRENADSQAVRDAKVRMRKTKEWVYAVEYKESRYTMPKTNVRERGRHDPSLTHGYEYRPRDNV
ncbi:hypothetical protein BC628DRAFT_1379831 [Trametes gibbosa]|nr:hypothetical protein BC628DRAFT_1379831 [Trametes gibbosa]